MDENNELYGINMTKKRLICNMNRSHVTVFFYSALTYKCTQSFFYYMNITYANTKHT